MRLSINLQPDLESYISNVPAFFNAFNRRMSRLERPYLQNGRLTQIVMKRFERNASKILKSEMRKALPQMAPYVTTSFAWHVDVELVVTIDFKTTRAFNNLAYTNISQLPH